MSLFKDDPMNENVDTKAVDVGEDDSVCEKGG
jgi:hypothetical protein